MTNTVEIELAPTVNLNTIGQLKAQLDEVVDKNSDVIIRAAHVEKIDTAALQLITVFNEKIKENGNTLSWLQPSEEVCNVVSLLGLESALCLTEK